MTWTPGADPVLRGGEDANEGRWRTWDEIEAEDRGRIDEARVAEHRERMRAEQRAYRLAEIRRQHREGE